MTTVSPLPKLWTEAEAAEYLRVSPRRIARLRAKNLLGSIRVGRSVFIREDQLQEYVGKCASTSGTTSATGPGPITSVGQMNLGAHAADLLAQEITGRRRSRSRESF